MRVGFLIGVLAAVFGFCGGREAIVTPAPDWAVSVTATGAAEVSTAKATTAITARATRRPTMTATATARPTLTQSPTAVPTPTLARTPRAATPTATWTPPPNLGMIHVNEAVRGRACPTISVMCPVMAVFIRGDEMILRGNTVIEGEDWLAVDHPSEPGRGRVWIWAAFDYGRWRKGERQAVEYVP